MRHAACTGWLRTAARVLISISVRPASSWEPAYHSGHSALNEDRAEGFSEEMHRDGTESRGMPMKAFLAVLAAGAIALGLALPIPHRSDAEPKSQFMTLDLGGG